MVQFRACLLVWLAGVIVATSACARPRQDEIWPRRQIAYQTARFSARGIDVSRADGELVLSVMGNLLAAPVGGGGTRTLVAGPGVRLSPRVSPDSRSIVYLSNAGEDGPADDFSLWIAARDGSDPRRISGDVGRFPTWAPDGRSLWGLDAAKPGLIHLDPDGRILGRVAIPAIYGFAVSTDGDTVFAAKGDTLSRVDLRSGVDMVLRSSANGLFAAPTLSPEGRRLAYVEIQGDLVRLRLRELDSGRDEVLAAWPGAASTGARIRYDWQQGAWPGFSFAGEDVIYFPVAESIQRIDVQSRNATSVPLIATVNREARVPLPTPSFKPKDTFAVRILRGTSWQPYGSRVAFSAVGRLWEFNAETGEVGRLNDIDVPQYMPAYSPDGRSLAYVTSSDAHTGGLHLIGPDGRDRTLLEDGALYANPTWTADGGSLVFWEARADLDMAPSNRPDGSLVLTVLNLETGEQRPIAHADWPELSVSRYYPPITATEDGSVYFSNIAYRSPTWVRTLFRTSVTEENAVPVAELAGTTDFAVVSPDGRRVAVYGNGRLEVRSMNAPGAAPIASLMHTSISYLSWKSADVLQWSFADDLAEWRLGAAEVVRRRVDLVIPRAQPDRVLLLENARVITVSGAGVLENVDLLIRGDRIDDIGRHGTLEKADITETLDLTGKTVIPGLIDTHRHSHTLNRRDVELQPRVQWSDLATLAFGVTTVFDPAADSAAIFSASESIDAGTSVGPRTFSTGLPLANSQLWRDPRGVPLETPEDADWAAEDRKRQGAIMLKLYGLTPTMRRRALDAARGVALGATVEGTAISDSVFADMFEAGLSAYEHEPRADTDYQMLIARSGVFLTPTVLVSSDEGAIIRRLKGDILWTDPRIDAYFPPYARPDPGSSVSTSGDTIPVLESVAGVVRQGGAVGVGGHGETGLHTHIEMRSLAIDGNLDSEQVLAAATIDNAKKIGAEAQIGSVEIGKLADLVILNSDPLIDIRNAADIWMVIKNGEVYDPLDAGHPR